MDHLKMNKKLNIKFVGTIKKCLLIENTLEIYIFFFTYVISFKCYGGNVFGALDVGTPSHYHHMKNLPLSDYMTHYHYPSLH